MNNIRIGIIGHFGGDKNFTDGQTVKTKEIEKVLRNDFSKTINKFDTYKNSRNIFKLFFGIKKIVKNSDVIILIVSSRGYKIILPLLIFFNMFYKKEIFDFVIGGSRYKIFEKNNFLKSLAKKCKRIYVETQSLLEKYNDLEIDNVTVLPNFKKLKIYADKKEFVKKDKIKLCTFTRVCKEKGIEDAIEAVKYANEKLKKDVFYLDIYGAPDNSYIDKFEKILKEFPEFIQYKGIINPNESSKIIKEYDVMLFLTYWNGEGFPGTILDSLFSGVPVIATDWNCNFEILREGYTGYKVEIKNPKQTGDLLIKCYNNQIEMCDMKENCLKEAIKYLPENVIKIFYKDILIDEKGENKNERRK